MTPEYFMSSYESLLARVRRVRTRWRSQVLVRGIAIFLAITIAVLILGVWGADLFGFKPAAVWFMRFLTGGTVLFIAWYFLYLPLHVRISDVTVAQFIEEKYPQLEDRLVTAIEYGNRKTSDPGMIDLLIQDALNQAARVDFSVFLNRQRLAAFGTLGFGSSLMLFALLMWGPSFFPYGFSNLYAPWTRASLGSAMAFILRMFIYTGRPRNPISGIPPSWSRIREAVLFGTSSSMSGPRNAIMSNQKEYARRSILCRSLIKRVWTELILRTISRLIPGCPLRLSKTRVT
jgi:hypothetical protein